MHSRNVGKRKNVCAMISEQPQVTVFIRMLHQESLNVEDYGYVVCVFIHALKSPTLRIKYTLTSLPLQTKQSSVLHKMCTLYTIMTKSYLGQRSVHFIFTYLQGEKQCMVGNGRKWQQLTVHSMTISARCSPVVLNPCPPSLSWA